MNGFSFAVRVYYEDTDAGGVVYHSQYLNFMERARTEWLRSMGFIQTELQAKMGIIIVVHNLQIKYQKPACFDDMLIIQTNLTRVGRCFLEFKQVVLRGDEQLTQATVEVVSVDAEKFKPVSIPAELSISFQALKIN